MPGARGSLLQIFGEGEIKIDAPPEDQPVPATGEKQEVMEKPTTVKEDKVNAKTEAEVKK